MDKRASPKTAEYAGAEEELLTTFARIMRDRYKARVYLFGSHARGTAREFSDYDLVAVSPTFSEQSPFRRCLDRAELWRAAGGWRKALDLHCYSPSEFRKELAGLGYLAHAHAHGELVRIVPARSARTKSIHSTSASTSFNDAISGPDHSSASTR